LRWDISKRLSKITYTKSNHDNNRKFYFHSTIAFKDIDRKFNKICSYLKSREEKKIRQHLLRITILKGNQILYEYDLLQGRLLNRAQAKNSNTWKKTIALLKQESSDFDEEMKGRNEGLWNKILALFGK
jgi:hypothetical protein